MCTTTQIKNTHSALLLCGVLACAPMRLSLVTDFSYSGEGVPRQLKATVMRIIEQVNCFMEITLPIFN
jgi:hypothetical protein